MEDYDSYIERKNLLLFCAERMQNEGLITYQESFGGYIGLYTMRFVKFVPANHPRELMHGCFPNMAYPVSITRRHIKDEGVAYTVSVRDIDDGFLVGHYDTPEEALDVFNKIRYGFTINDLYKLGMK